MEKGQENAKKAVKRVDFLTESDEKVYSFTKNQALELLEKEEVTHSEQMLNKWCRDGNIDAVFIAKGAPKARGLRISKTSLEAFIQAKKGNVENLVLELNEKDDKIKRLEEELKAVRKELQELKKNGLYKPKEAKPTELNKTSLSADNAELTFTIDKGRALHYAIFNDEGNLVSVEKNTKGKGKEDVLKSLSDEVKELIIKTRKDLLESI